MKNSFRKYFDPFYNVQARGTGHWKRPNAYLGKVSPGGPKKEVQKCISSHTLWL